jgi:ABC-2 type transport system ATP-binding protein
MTTHYLDEAEGCDRVAIIDHGHVVAEGTPAVLRRRAGSDRVSLATDDDERAAAALTAAGFSPRRTPAGIELEVESGEGALPRLAALPVPLRELQIRKPTLEDAFIALTGRAIREEEADAKEILRGLVRARRRG